MIKFFFLVWIAGISFRDAATVQLKGKVALVTGASRGIGKGIALGLAEAGATVYITGRSCQGTVTDKSVGGTLEEVVEAVNALGGKGIAIQCDHKNDEQVKNVFKQIESEHGHLDLLVNNAFQIPVPPNGEDDPDLLFRDFWEQPGWFWDAFNNVGLRSHYTATSFAFPLLQKAKDMFKDRKPLIVHVSSFGGVSYSFNVAYGVGKAGVDRMAKDMHKELKPHGISIISFYPGVVRTERMSSMLSGGDWTKKTGLACPEPLIESPRFAGRVIAALAADVDASKNLVEQNSGGVLVAAEVAKILGVIDVNGNLPPSIRSTKFLIPGLLLGKLKDAPKALEEALVKYSPDILLPMSVMAGGTPGE